ncbi:MAG TPA: GNAT family N-acetyltransferase [Pyrinomonadaceae bacterium]
MIETNRLKLIPCDLPHFEAILKEQQQLASLLNVKLAKDWLEFDAAQEAMQPSYQHLESHPEILGWWTYLFVHKPDQTLIGLGGFKGLVNDEGVVELGYAIAPDYRRRGLASEATLGMIQYAFAHPEIKRVDAHTLPEKNPSTGVLEKVGMKFVGPVHDPDDGEVWHWSLNRDDYRLASSGLQSTTG